MKVLGVSLKTNYMYLSLIAFNWITGKSTSHDGEAELEIGAVSEATAIASDVQIPSQPSRKHSTYGRPVSTAIP